MKKQNIFDDVKRLYETAHYFYDMYAEQEKTARENYNLHPDDLNARIKLHMTMDTRSHYLGKMNAYVSVLELINKEDA